MRWLHLVAPTGVTAVVFVGLILTQGDPWGDDLPSVIQAAGSVALLAVTASYVVFTSEMARTSARQLAFMADERHKAEADLQHASLAKGWIDLGAWIAVTEESLEAILRLRNGAVLGRSSLIEMRDALHSSREELAEVHRGLSTLFLGMSGPTAAELFRGVNLVEHLLRGQPLLLDDLIKAIPIGAPPALTTETVDRLMFERHGDAEFPTLAPRFVTHIVHDLLLAMAHARLFIAQEIEEHRVLPTRD